MIQTIFPNIIGSNVYQLQTSLTLHCIDKITLFSIYYRLHSSGNVFDVFGVFGVPNILAIKKSDLISNIMRGACYETTLESLFRISSFSIMKCARAIPTVYAVLLSL